MRGGLLAEVRRAIRVRHYSRRTEQAYVGWVRRYVRSLGLRHPADADAGELRRFLTDLAERDRVSAATQNQAVAALLFLYRHVLGRPLVGDLGIVRARPSASLPAVLTRAEIQRVFAVMRGTNRLVAELLYGSGLRLGEAVTLRVKDVDLARGELRLREAKGRRARVTMLARSTAALLEAHLERLRVRWSAEAAAGGGGVPLPGALHRKIPAATFEWAWQWVFPGTHRHRGRHHPTRVPLPRAQACRAKSLKHNFFSSHLKNGRISRASLSRVSTTSRTSIRPGWKKRSAGPPNSGPGWFRRFLPPR